MMKLAFAATFAVGLSFGLLGCPGNGAGEGEGEGGEGEGEGAGEGEGEGAGEGEGEGEGAPGPTICQEECASNADCTVNNGTDINFVCTNGRCTSAAAGCANNTQCVGQFSGWQQADTNNDFIGDTNCNGNNGDATATVPCGASATVCVDVFGDGTGLCAFDNAGALSCATLQQTAVSFNDVGGTAHDVCVANGADDATCGADGVCANPCVADADCGGALKCRVADGKCVACLADGDCSNGSLNTCIDQTYCGCAADGDCTGSAAGGFCIVADGLCGCAANADCAGSPTGDICTTGLCGCASAATDCNGTPTFDNTTYVCQ